MSLHARLSIALNSADIGGDLAPFADDQTGLIAVFGPRRGDDLSDLPRDRIRIITTFYPDHAHFTRLGYECALTADAGPYAAALVIAPRAKALAHDLIARAHAVTEGPVLVDGGKQDGIESLMKACRKRGTISAPISKAHGKLFWGLGGDYSDWRADPDMPPITAPDGQVFHTAPGVFSADGVDPASQLLANHLPQDLGRRVIDLGAGWGFLSARALTRGSIRQIDLVEADHTALTCAQRNITDDRAKFHWADATNWVSPALADSVIMNPPFHQSRKADPDLGRAFIASAAACLGPNGRLYMVANRHLPYETTLAEHFRQVDEIAGSTAGGGAFKLFVASQPARHRRRDRLG